MGKVYTDADEELVVRGDLDATSGTERFQGLGEDTAPGVNHWGYYIETYTTTSLREHPTSLQCVTDLALAAVTDNMGDTPPNIVNPVRGGPLEIDWRYTATGIPAVNPPYTTTIRTSHDFQLQSIAAANVDDGVYYPDDGYMGYLVTPDDLDWPDGVNGWEWADDPGGADQDPRPAEVVECLVKVIAPFDLPMDTSATPSAEVKGFTTVYVQTTGIEWGTDGTAPAADYEMQSWTPAQNSAPYAHPIGGIDPFTWAGPGTSFVADVTPYLDEQGRALLWARTPPFAIPPDSATEPIGPDTPGYFSSGSNKGPMSQGYTLEYRTQWTFRFPAFRWYTLTSDSAKPPRLRHLNIAPDRRGENWRGTSLRRISSYQ